MPAANPASEIRFWQLELDPERAPFEDAKDLVREVRGRRDGAEVRRRSVGRASVGRDKEESGGSVVA